MEQEAFYTVGEFDRSRVDLNKPAMTVEEYMQQVVAGRELLPDVAVAPAEVLKRVSATSSKMYNVPGMRENSHTFTNRFGPNKEWCVTKSNEFSRSRSVIESIKVPDDPLKDIKLPPVSDSMRWCQCFAHHKGTPPTVALTTSLNDNQVNELIIHQVNYMLSKGQTRATLQWLYALLLVVKKPLLHEVCSSLRDFCRKCKEWRSELDEDEEETNYQLSFFISIISIYFAQRDLADHP
uniref:Gem-associated protein 2 n=1 Tax=Globodera rostochiensis TaxID=31243 RepID=A0A914GT46_GLORO